MRQVANRFPAASVNVGQVGTLCHRPHSRFHDDLLLADSTVPSSCRLVMTCAAALERCDRAAATNEPRRVMKSIKQGGFALPLDTSPMEAASAATLPIDGARGSTSRNGTDFVASLSRKAIPSTCVRNRASHSAAIFRR